MVVAVYLTVAAIAQGIVVFAVIGLEFVHNAVFAKAVQHTVYRYAVYAAICLAYNGVLAHGAAFLGKDIHYGLLGGGVPSFHKSFIATKLQ